MNILAIDTSCDETAASVTNNTKLLSSIIWSQASVHANFGGVIPSVAQREHQERIDSVISKALGKRYKNFKNIDAIAVTIGPGLAVALGVGIEKAKEIATKNSLPLIPINHVESHLLSPFAIPKSKTDNLKIRYPALGLVLSGGTTILTKIKSVGEYEILAKTQDDAIGEALDKGARLLGFGYPGGSILEKVAKLGDIQKFNLPLPLQNDVIKNRFSYSGIKTAFVRLFNSINSPTKQDIYDLAAVYQNISFKHIAKVLEYQIVNSNVKYQDLLFGGGVANNTEVKKMLRKVCKKHGIKLHVPYNKRLNGDNAGMVGVCAYLKNKDLSNNGLIKNYGGIDSINSVDRNPRLSIC